MRRRILAILAAVIATPAVVLGGFTLTAFNPPPQLALTPLSKGPASWAPMESMTLLTWNIGYAGLDKDADFFMDGGQMPGPRSREAVEENLQAILETLSANPADTVMLQEVDRPSSRSYGIDEVAAIADALPKLQGWHGVNFKSPFVPVPMMSPIGQVHSGILTLLKTPALEVVRHQLPGFYSWPVRLFHLKRCATVAVVPSPDPKRDWHLVNLHLSAFDDGSQRAQQLEYLAAWMVAKYNQGHYVILGGDWNSVFPGVDRELFQPYTTAAQDLAWLKDIPASFTPEGWTWAFDKNVATCRTNDKPFRDNENYRTIIDGFLLSPNVELVWAKGLDLKFTHSDHNPVMARVKARLSER